MQLFSEDAIMFFFLLFFAHENGYENMKNPASKVAHNQPKFLFHKNLPPQDFSIMTLGVLQNTKEFVDSNFLTVF